ncbi:Rox3-domain-containing protein [Xylariaceae sp. FL0016]|nr:Rox3-domain-containing protein [Xylariaceae sp. FL0016]
MATMSFNPQTPQSPSQFSPNTADHSSSMNSSMTSITTTSLPTPAHSVNGSHQPSDTSQDIIMTDDTSNKRKNPFGDVGNNEHKKPAFEDPRKIGISDLHMDVGEKYLLCRTPHSVPSPRMTEDLYEKFGLTGIAADVARTKPNGEKNALRKTYKGQIKSLGLSGHFDVVKKEHSAFMELVNIAEEDWHNRAVAGREIEKGFSQSTLSSLARAMTMAKGQIPKDAWDSSVLGDMAPGAPKKTDTSRQTAPSTPAASGAGSIVKSKSQMSQIDRAHRIGKKRSYKDSSFEGYGEGFIDDDASGYSTNDDRSAKFKKRKQNPTNMSTSFSDSTAAFGART